MSPNDRLDSALDAWQVAFDAGNDRPVADLLPDDPDLLHELEKRVAVLRRVMAAQQHLHDPDCETHNPTPATDGSTKAPSTVATAQRMGTRSPVDAPPGFAFEKELGRGGMGLVYLAHQLGLNRPVALKMILDTAGTNAIIRFLAEAEAVAAVKHPNVVEVYQFGEHHGQPYLALEYCPGGELTAKTNAGRIAPREAAVWMAAITEGVNAAHSLGIVHRDLKPSNVLLAADGTPKVSDFGLAKKQNGRADLTASEAVVGTAAYMSPEQAGGGAKFVGPESDVWALGVMLYELLAGLRPFAGPSFLDYRVQILGHHLIPLRQTFPEVPRDLELIVLKCLRQEPRERYANAGELAADLRNWLVGKPISARPMGSIETVWKWSRRNPTMATSLVVAALALVLGTAVSLWQASEARREADKASQAAKREEDQRRLAEQNLAFAERETQRASEAEKEAQLRLRETEKAQSIAAQNEKLSNARTYQLLESYNQMVSAIQTKLSSHAGTQMVRRELLKIAQAGLQGILAEVQEIGPASRILVVSYYRLGDVEQSLGFPSKAERHYKLAFELTGKLLATNSDDEDLLLERAVVSQRLADVLPQLGRKIEAVQHSEDSQSNLRKLCKKKPNNHALQLQLASSCDSLGVLLSNLGKHQASRKAYQESLELVEPLASLYLNSLSVQYQVSVAYERVGDSYLAMRQFDSAEQAYRNKLATDERAAKSFPGNPQVTRNLGFSYDRLATLAACQGEGTKAIEYYKKSGEYRKQLLALEPSNAFDMRDLSITYLHLGDRYRDSRNLSTAAEWYTRSRDLRIALVESDTRSTRALQDLASIFDRLARIALETNDLTTARDHLSKSLAQWQKLADLEPDNPTPQRYLSIGFDKLGDLALNSGQPKESLEYYQQALMIDIKRSEHDRKNTQVLQDLKCSYCKLGNVMLKTGQTKESLDCYQKSHAIDQRRADENTQDLEAQRNLSFSFKRLAEVTRHFGATKDVIALYRKGLDIDQKLADASPKCFEAQRTLSLCLEKIGSILQESQNIQGAIEWYEKALAIAEKFDQAALFSEDAKRFKQEIAACRLKLKTQKSSEVAPQPRMAK